MPNVYTILNSYERIYVCGRSFRKYVRMGKRWVMWSSRYGTMAGPCGHLPR